MRPRLRLQLIVPSATRATVGKRNTHACDHKNTQRCGTISFLRCLLVLFFVRKRQGGKSETRAQPHESQTHKQSNDESASPNPSSGTKEGGGRNNGGKAERASAHLRELVQTSKRGERAYHRWWHPPPLVGQSAARAHLRREKRGGGPVRVCVVHCEQRK